MVAVHEASRTAFNHCGAHVPADWDAIKTQLELPPGWEDGRLITYIDFHLRVGLCFSSHKAPVAFTPQQQQKTDEEITSAHTQGTLLRYEPD